MVGALAPASDDTSRLKAVRSPGVLNRTFCPTCPAGRTGQHIHDQFSFDPNLARPDSPCACAHRFPNRLRNITSSPRVLLLRLILDESETLMSHRSTLPIVLCALSMLVLGGTPSVAQNVPPLDKIQNQEDLDKAITALDAALF